MINRQLIIVCIVLFTAAILFAVTTFHQQAQDRQIQNKSQSQQDEATHIQEGLMTEKQRKHSRLYEKLISEEDKKAIKNRNLITSAKKSSEGIDVIVVGEEKTITDNQLLPTQEEFLKQNNCKADTIVVGKITAKTSQLTEDLTSVFTDYDFVVSDILRDNLSLNIKPPESILITRAGGKVEVDNRIIDYIIKSKKRLILEKKYLIFLNYLSESKSFKIVEPEGVFEISGNEFTRFSDNNSPYKITDKSSNNLINFVRNDLNQCFSEGENK